jgi:sulfur carrier protein
MVNITLNGNKTEIPSRMTIDQLITRLGFNAKWVVAELNGKALIKTDYDKTFLSSGDRIELVRAVSGG